MDEREAREYLENVMRGKTAVQGLERSVVQRLQQTNLESLRMEKEISSLSTAQEQAKRRLYELNGLREGYAQILIEAEDGRRDVKATTPMKAVPENKAHDLDDTECKVLSDLIGRKVDRAELHVAAQGEKPHGHAGR